MKLKWEKIYHQYHASGGGFRFICQSVGNTKATQHTISICEGEVFLETIIFDGTSVQARKHAQEWLDAWDKGKGFGLYPSS